MDGASHNWKTVVIRLGILNRGFSASRCNVSRRKTQSSKDDRFRTDYKIRASSAWSRFLLLITWANWNPGADRILATSQVATSSLYGLFRYIDYLGTSNSFRFLPRLRRIFSSRFFKTSSGLPSPELLSFAPFTSHDSHMPHMHHLSVMQFHHIRAVLMSHDQSKKIAALKMRRLQVRSFVTM